jgi:ribosomal protein S4
MNKLQPKNKICFQNKALRAKLRFSKYRNKKWNILRRHLKYRKELKPESRKRFFQKRLFEKQQFQNFYQVKYYQLKNLYNFFKRKKAIPNIFQSFVYTLDSRLDISLVRLNLANSVYHAKQLITHNKIKLNKKIVNKNNILLKQGDFILRIHDSTTNYTTKQKQQYKQEILSEKKNRKKIFLEKLQKLIIKQKRNPKFTPYFYYKGRMVR